MAAAVLKNNLWIAIETDGYTPNNIDKREIQYNDRPYASTLLVKSFNTALSAERLERLTNTLTVGVLGPLAGGKRDSNFPYINGSVTRGR